MNAIEITGEPILHGGQEKFLFNVIEISVCPKICCNTTADIPDSMQRVAKVCRSICVLPSLIFIFLHILLMYKDFR